MRNNDGRKICDVCCVNTIYALCFYSALLFDVAPDLNEYDPKFFTLRIGPTIYNSPFNADSGDDPCYDTSRFKREDRTVNLKTLYADYKTCKNDTRRFINSVKEALTALSIFDDIQMRDLTIHFIDLCIMKEFYQVSLSSFDTSQMFNSSPHRFSLRRTRFERRI